MLGAHSCKICPCWTSHSAGWESDTMIALVTSTTNHLNDAVITATSIFMLLSRDLLPDSSRKFSATFLPLIHKTSVNHCIKASVYFCISFAGIFTYQLWNFLFCQSLFSCDYDLAEAAKAIFVSAVVVPAHNVSAKYSNLSNVFCCSIYWPFSLYSASILVSHTTIERLSIMFVDMHIGPSMC